MSFLSYNFINIQHLEILSISKFWTEKSMIRSSSCYRNQHPTPPKANQNNKTIAQPKTSIEMNSFRRGANIDAINSNEIYVINITGIEFDGNVKIESKITNRDWLRFSIVPITMHARMTFYSIRLTKSRFCRTGFRYCSHFHCHCRCQCGCWYCCCSYAHTINKDCWCLMSASRIIAKLMPFSQSFNSHKSLVSGRHLHRVAYTR